MIQTRWAVILAVFVALLLPGGEAAEPGAARRTRHVVIAVMDGVRWSESFGDPQRANVPRLAALAKNGVLFTNFRNGGATLTTPSHAALLTGFYENLENSGGETPGYPSFMQIWRKSANAPPAQAWVIAAKAKLAVLANCANPEWKDRFTPSADCGQDKTDPEGERRSDEDTAAVAKEVLTRDHPRAMLINLSDTDYAGHAGRWTAYLEAIQASDALLAGLWEAIQQDATLRDATALFIVNDHGRHGGENARAFSGHGCPCEGCRHILCLALGPDFRRGAATDAPAELIDVAATAAELLGVRLPGSKGRVLNELFAGEAERVNVPASKQPPTPVIR